MKLCERCLSDVETEQIPLLSKWNLVHVVPQPVQSQRLNALERTLCSPVRAVQSIFQLQTVSGVTAKTKAGQ